MNDEIKEILDNLKNKDNDIKGINFLKHQDLTRGEINLILDYITNLQQRNNNLIEDFKRHINRINELTERNDNLQQENEDNLKCIKSLKEQLESVIKNNQELLEKWHKNNDKIVNLISENERLKELVDADNESYDIQETIINRQKSELLEQEDYKSRCEKASDFIEWHYKDNKEFYKNKGIGLNYPECDALLNILQNGSDDNE